VPNMREMARVRGQVSTHKGKGGWLRACTTREGHEGGEGRCGCMHGSAHMHTGSLSVCVHVLACMWRRGKGEKARERTQHVLTWVVMSGGGWASAWVHDVEVRVGGPEHACNAQQVWWLPDAC